MQPPEANSTIHARLNALHRRHLRMRAAFKAAAHNPIAI
jgi:hypothetical protein